MEDESKICENRKGLLFLFIMLCLLFSLPCFCLLRPLLRWIDRNAGDGLSAMPTPQNRPPQIPTKIFRSFSIPTPIEEGTKSRSRCASYLRLYKPSLTFEKMDGLDTDWTTWLNQGLLLIALEGNNDHLSRAVAEWESGSNAENIESESLVRTLAEFFDKSCREWYEMQLQRSKLDIHKGFKTEKKENGYLWSFIYYYEILKNRPEKPIQSHHFAIEPLAQ